MTLWFILILLRLIYQPGFEMIFEGIAPSGEFYTDHLENIYFIDGHRIVKTETTTGEVMEYGSLSAGVITSADICNPMQIMVFYRDFNKVLFLDNKLAQLRPAINLADKGIEQAHLVSSSGRGGFWVFSDYWNRLIYFDQQLRNTHQGINISSVTGSGRKPVYMTEASNLLYLHVPGHGILVFDRFAAYLRTIPYSGPERFQVTGGRIVYFLNGELHGIDSENLETKIIALPPGLKADNARMHPKRMYILSGNKIRLFRVDL
jgi:hypothetical protein